MGLTKFIKSLEKILSEKSIKHFKVGENIEVETSDFLPQKEVVDILLTSGASCPDATVERVLRKIHSFFASSRDIDEITKMF